MKNNLVTFFPELFFNTLMQFLNFFYCGFLLKIKLDLNDARGSAHPGVNVANTRI